MKSMASVRLAAVGAAAFVTASATATFHFMQIEQVIGGVGGDTTAQAVQLRMRFNGQCFLDPARLIVHDATGSNPDMVFNFGPPCDPFPTPCVTGCGAGDRVLVASDAFIDATNPSASPDFIMDNLIPATYLAAGSLTFEDTAGTVLWRLSWGGAAYTGPTTGSITNDLDGEFGPPWPDPLPSTGTQALLFQGTAGALSTNNADDYELTVGDAVFTNNADESFTVRVDAPCPWDCADGGNGDVGITDFLKLLADWGLPSTCDFDGGGVGINDFLKLLANWGLCP